MFSVLRNLAFFFPFFFFLVLLAGWMTSGPVLVTIINRRSRPPDAYKWSHKVLMIIYYRRDHKSRHNSRREKEGKGKYCMYLQEKAAGRDSSGYFDGGFLAAACTDNGPPSHKYNNNNNSHQNRETYNK